MDHCTYTTRKLQATEAIQLVTQPALSFDLGAHWVRVDHVTTVEHGERADFIVHDSHGNEYELQKGDWVTALVVVPAAPAISPWYLHLLEFGADPADATAWMRMPLAEPMTREIAINTAEHLLNRGEVMRAYVWHKGYSSPAVRLGWNRMEEPRVRRPLQRPRRCEADAHKGTGTGMCDHVLDASGDCHNASSHIEP
jgi:hypothetical protein